MKILNKIAFNSPLDRIEQQNQDTLTEANAFRQRLQAGIAQRSDIPKLKQKHPYFGILPVSAAGLEVLMLHAHDDVVAWEYIWNGVDGYETEMVQTWVNWCRTSPGCILDIGAYSGLMSLLAAKAHPKNEVHLFEPLERVIERANVNVKLNGLTQRVFRHAVAASDHNGHAEITLYRDENFLGTGSSIYCKEGKQTFGAKQIQTVALDTFLPGICPTVVKIDVEGHELACLQGLEHTIARSKPKMLVEVWEHTRFHVLALLDAYGYEVQRFEAMECGVNNYSATPLP